MLDNSPKQFMGSSDVNCLTIYQPNSLENLPLKFLSQPFYFLFSFMSLLEPSLTPSRMPKPNVRKHCFQNKRFLFSKTYYRVLVKSIGQPSEANLLDNSPKQFMGSSDVNCLTISQPNSPENLPLKFLSQPFYFLFSFMSRTHTYHSRVPRCIWNALCYFQTIHVNI